MVELHNSKIKLVYDKDGYIQSLKYEDKEYIGARLPVFAMALRDKDGGQTRVNAFDMKNNACALSGNVLCCSYNNEDISVDIEIILDQNIEWKIKVQGIKDKVIEWVDYPQIAVPDDFADNDGTSRVLWGFNEGTLIENMTDRENGIPYFEPEYPCKGIMGVYPAIVETQFMAYYNEKSGMYFAAHDKNNNLKGINVHRQNGGVKLEFRHFTGCNFDEGYEMPYPMIIKFFKGDWSDACEIYRSWFYSLEKSEFIKIEDNKKLPAWYSESPVVIAYPVRGKHDTDVMNPNKLFPYINVLPHVKRFEKMFNSKIMVLLMHWEGTAPWAPPVVWPPYGGEEELKKLIDALHDRGDILGVYTSGLGWTIKSNLVDDYDTQDYFDEHNLKDEMCVSPQLELTYSNICTAQRSGYDLCPTRDFTKNVISEQVEHMVNAGIDYIQLMDQNHGGTSYFCYSREHGHPPVPGRWQVDAMRELLSEINKRTGSVLLGCESAAAESYIPNLLFNDNRFNIAYYIGRPVPAYAYIYHEYINNFMGNQVCVDWHIDLDKSPESFFERIGYSFSAGDMLTVVITENGEIDWNWGRFDREKTLPNQKQAEAFIRNLNYWKSGPGKKYINFGAMIKPLKIECEKYIIWRTDGSKTEVPRLYTSAWKASDGDIAQFLVNYSSESRYAVVEFDNDYTMYTHSGESKFVKRGKRKIEVNPFSAVMMVLNR